MAKNNSKEDIHNRIEKLKQQLKKQGKGNIIALGEGGCSPELEEKFYQYILAFEQIEAVQLFEILVNGGLELPTPEKLDNVQISKKLWQVINGLSLLGVFLYSTDHLSDRELYEYLWYDCLHEPTVIQPENQDSAYHVDLIGSGSEEDLFIFLKYYADETDRKMWAGDLPQNDFPGSEKKPYDRDRLLPTRENWREARC